MKGSEPINAVLTMIYAGSGIPAVESTPAIIHLRDVGENLSKVDVGLKVTPSTPDG